MVLLGLCASAAEKKPQEVTVVEFTAKRDGGTILIDGRLRISGERPIENLVLAFDFLAGGRSSVATKQVEVDEPRLAPGDESAFHLAASAPARAVTIKVKAFRNRSLELGVENAGPFPIEE